MQKDTKVILIKKIEIRDFNNGLILNSLAFANDKEGFRDLINDEMNLDIQTGLPYPFFIKTKL